MCTFKVWLGLSLISVITNSIENQVIWPNNFTIGLITSMSDQRFYKLTFDETVKRLKRDQVVPWALQLQLSQLTACDDASSLNASFELFFHQNVAVLFGPECSAGMATAALFASTINKPIFGFVSVTSYLIDKTKYTTLTRTSHTISYIARAITLLLINYNWTSIAVVQNKGACDVPLSGITEIFQSSHIDVVNTLIASFQSSDELSSVLKSISDTARIILVCGGYSPKDALPFMKAATEAKMMNSQYVYITPFFAKLNLTHWEPWLDAALIKNATVEELKSYYRNAVLIQTRGELSDEHQNFTNYLKDIVTSDPGFYGINTWNNDDMVRLAPLHDALYLYGKILNNTVTNGYDFKSGRVVFSEAVDSEFIGITGRVLVDSIAERVSNYYVEKMNESGDFEYFIQMGQTKDNFTMRYDILEFNGSPNWGTENNEVPNAIPICGFTNERCTSQTVNKPLAIGIPTAIVGFFCLVVVSVLGYKKHMYERELEHLSWKIDSRELQYVSKHHFQSSLSRSTSTLHHRIEKSVSKSHPDFKETEHFDGHALHRGTVITVERWKRNGNVTFKREHFVRLKNMKEVNHENLNIFVGFSHDSTFKMCLWVHCSKGNLHDIVFNDDIKLDHMFKVAILRDVVSGLEYLHHSPILYHGRLFLSECVVDGRWTVKLSNFGLNDLLAEMRKQKVIGIEEHLDSTNLLCSAPEVLRHQIPINLQSVDIYQFSMILYQVVFRQEPFADLEVMNSEIITSLKNGNFRGAVLRPKVQKVEEFDVQFHELMHHMWNENPLQRPIVTDVKKEIFGRTKKIFGSKNLIDHVMSMLEKYAANLEKIVDERTSQLKEEQKRADQLLYQMLPRSVADSLKSGHPVAPELFDCVTVYFSDIVGFTKICSRSKPVEIVAMLNGAYSQFDSVILRFDAYKVETIGDAYLVVSGLPVRNGNRHVTTIAEMSLKIMQVLGAYRIPHLPDERVQIRIGIHSGSVAGGVVGLTMPKYCLFGDTVNMASRMESSGEASKIHISEVTKTLLQESNTSFMITERGEIEIKGKGLCRTFWLMKKENTK